MYLLDTQQVMDLFSRDQTRSIFGWLRETTPGKTDLFVSVLSLGQIAHAIDDMAPTERNQWRRLMQEGQRQFVEAGGVIDVDASIVDVWQSSLRGDRLSHIANADEELGEDDRLILATAIARSYTLVTEESETLRGIAAHTTLAIIEL